MLRKLGKIKDAAFPKQLTLEKKKKKKKKKNTHTHTHKKHSYQVKYAVFQQFKEKDTALPQLSYKIRRFTLV